MDNILYVKHGLWILATLIVLYKNVKTFWGAEMTIGSGLEVLATLAISGLCYMGFWIIWLIIF
jgi:hypothetical protein